MVRVPYKPEPVRRFPTGHKPTASPLAFWWLDTATVYALGLVVIASVYIGFAVADGRWTVIAAESGVASVFVVVAAAAVTGSAWLLVAGLAGGASVSGSTRIEFLASFWLVRATDLAS